MGGEGRGGEGRGRRCAPAMSGSAQREGSIRRDSSGGGRGGPQGSREELSISIACRVSQHRDRVSRVSASASRAACLSTELPRGEVGPRAAVGGGAPWGVVLGLHAVGGCRRGVRWGSSRCVWLRRV
jgi:hypothetical protein